MWPWRCRPTRGSSWRRTCSTAGRSSIPRRCVSRTDDIARFFDGSLPHAELTALEEHTAGWPVALAVYRNTRSAEGKLLGADAAQITTNYIGMRLLGDLSKQDRVCLLDLAVFDWIDAELVDDVLGSSAARLRVVSSSSLHGLLPTKRRTSGRSPAGFVVERRTVTTSFPTA